MPPYAARARRTISSGSLPHATTRSTGESGALFAVSVGGNVSPDVAAAAVFVGGNKVGASVCGMRPQAVINLLNVSEPALSIMKRRKSRRENFFMSASPSDGNYKYGTITSQTVYSINE
jgi:hypothetical protein